MQKLEPINEFIGIQINIQKLVAFLHTKNIRKRKFLKSPFKITSKNKILGKKPNQGDERLICSELQNVDKEN